MLGSDLVLISVAQHAVVVLAVEGALDRVQFVLHTALLRALALVLHALVTPLLRDGAWVVVEHVCAPDLVDSVQSVFTWTGRVIKRTRLHLVWSCLGFFTGRIVDVDLSSIRGVY